MPAPGAQVPGPITARFVLARDPRHVDDAELGLRGVLGGPDPLLRPGDALLTLEPRALSVSACKPADDGDGIVVRVMNATDASEEAVLHLGFAFDEAIAIRLDETPTGEPIARDETTVRFPVPAHALRSVRLRPERRGSRSADQAAALNRER